MTALNAPNTAITPMMTSPSFAAWSTTGSSMEPPTVKPPRKSGSVKLGTVNRTSSPLWVVSAINATRMKANTTPSVNRIGNARANGPDSPYALTISQAMPTTITT